MTIAGTGHQMSVPQPLRRLAQQAPADLLGQPGPLLLTFLGQLSQQLWAEEETQDRPPSTLPAIQGPTSPRTHLGLLFHQLL